MKTWITKFTGEYFLSPDSCSISSSIATEIKSNMQTDTYREIKIQKEMVRLVREQAIKNLSLDPDPIEPIMITPIKSDSKEPATP